MKNNVNAPKKEKKESILLINFKVLKFVFKFCPFYVIATVFFIAASCIEAIQEVVLIKEAIQMVIDGVEFNILLNCLIKRMAIIAGCYFFTVLYNRYLRARNMMIYRKKIQKFLYAKVKKVDMASYDDPEFFDKFTRGLQDAAWRGIRVFETFSSFTQAICTSIALGAYVVLDDPWLLVIILISSIINIFVVNYCNTVWHKNWRECHTDRRYYWYVNRIFYGQKYAGEIKTTNVGNLLIDKYDEKTKSIEEKYNQAYKKVGPAELTARLSSNLIEQAGSYLYLGYKLFTVSTFTVALFTSTINATLKFSANFKRAISVYTELRDHSLYNKDFLWILDYKPEVEKDGNKDIEDFKTLDINDITFSYPKTDFNSIQSLSMHIKEGDKIAIVGDNGGGKTTLMKLILRFYNPKEGSITYNGKDISEFNGKEYRSKFSIIFQDFQIYAKSIAENVLLRPCYNEEDEKIVKDALEKVGLIDYVNTFPKGIYTQVTKEFDENGAEFSGGERQRLAIARVFASNAAIYVLDEPTSALDPLAEEKINKLIVSQAENKTIIIIAHRLSTVVDMDKIYLIRNGEVKEQGTHEELIELGGIYNEMFSTQKKLYQRDE